MLHLKVVLDCVELAHLTRHLDKVVIKVQNCSIILRDKRLNVLVVSSSLFQLIKDLLLEL